jgi:hypothetical protein
MVHFRGKYRAIYGSIMSIMSIIWDFSHIVDPKKSINIRSFVPKSIKLPFVSINTIMVAQRPVLFSWVAAARLAVCSVVSMRVVSEHHLQTHSHLQQLHKQVPSLETTSSARIERTEWQACSAGHGLLE